MLKGTKDGIIINIRSLEDLVELENKIKSKAYFYKDTKFLMYSDDNYLNEVLKILENNGHFLNILDSPNEEAIKKDRTIEDTNKYSEGSIVIRKTLRSGQKIEFEGNVIVLGNVNPGAEIVSTGDIYVFGKAMGLLHAGSKGDKTKIIVALKLDVIQIRIANIYAKYEGKFEDRIIKAEKAFIEKDSITIEEYKPYD